MIAATNALERFALWLLRRDLDRGDGRLHRLSLSEIDQIRRMRRLVVAVSALAGALSGAILGLAEIGLGEPDADSLAWPPDLGYWTRYLGVAVLVSAAELLVLYWSLLRIVGRIGSIAGVRLSDREIEQVIALGLSRAALDLPNPRTPIHGVDPYARVPRWKLALASVVYRLKVGATTFALRLLLRRILGRAAVRLASALVAIPVFAFWNALIAAWIIREARIRAAGPLAVQELGDLIAGRRDDLNDDARRAVLAAAGESILRAADAHPNFVLLTSRLLEELEVPPAALADWHAARERLPMLPPHAQDVLLATLLAATLLGGDRRAQRKLLREAHDACGRPFDRRALRHSMRMFVDGQGLAGMPPSLSRPAR